MRAKGQLSKKCLVAFLLCFLQESAARNVMMRAAPFYYMWLRFIGKAKLSDRR